MSRRPRIGLSPSFYARFGLADPWIDTSLDAAPGEVDDAFTFLSARPYFQMMRRLALSRWWRERRRQRFERGRIGLRTADRRRFPGEAPKARPIIGGLWDRTLDMGAMALPEPWAPAAAEDTAQQAGATSGARRRNLPSRPVASPWLVRPYTPARVAARPERREVAEPAPAVRPERRAAPTSTPVTPRQARPAAEPVVIREVVSSPSSDAAPPAPSKAAPSAASGSSPAAARSSAPRATTASPAADRTEQAAPQPTAARPRPIAASAAPTAEPGSTAEPRSPAGASTPARPTARPTTAASTPTVSASDQPDAPTSSTSLVERIARRATASPVTAASVPSAEAAPARAATPATASTKTAVETTLPVTSAAPVAPIAQEPVAAGFAPPAEPPARIRPAERAGRRLAAVVDARDPIARVLEDAAPLLDEGTRRAVRQVIEVTRHLDDAERVIRVQRVLRRSAPTRFVQDAIEDVASSARPASFAAGRIPESGRRTFGLRPVLFGSPAMQTVEPEPVASPAEETSRPRRQPRSAPTHRRPSVAWAAARAVTGIQAPGAPAPRASADRAPMTGAPASRTSAPSGPSASSPPAVERPISRRTSVSRAVAAAGAMRSVEASETPTSTATPAQSSSETPRSSTSPVGVPSGAPAVPGRTLRTAVAPSLSASPVGRQVRALGEAVTPDRLTASPVLRSARRAAVTRMVTSEDGVYVAAPAEVSPVEAGDRSSPRAASAGARVVRGGLTPAATRAPAPQQAFEAPRSPRTERAPASRPASAQSTPETVDFAAPTEAPTQRAARRAAARPSTLAPRVDRPVEAPIAPSVLRRQPVEQVEALASATPMTLAVERLLRSGAPAAAQHPLVQRLLGATPVPAESAAEATVAGPVERIQARADEAPGRVGTATDWAAERLSTTGLPRDRANAPASLLPRMAPVMHETPIVLTAHSESEAQAIAQQVRQQLPRAEVRVRRSPWLERPYSPARVAGRAPSGGLSAAVSRDLVAPVTGRTAAQSFTGWAGQRLDLADPTRTPGPVSYAQPPARFGAFVAPDGTVLSGGPGSDVVAPAATASRTSTWTGAVVARTPKGQTIGTRGFTTPSGEWIGTSSVRTPGGAFAGASSFRTPGGAFAGASSFRTPGGAFAGASSFRTPGSDFAGASSFRTPGGDFAGASSFRTPGGAFAGASVTRTARGVYSGASTWLTPGGDFQGAVVARTPEGTYVPARVARTPGGDFQGASSFTTPGGAFVGARVGQGRPLDWVGARVSTSPWSGYRGAFVARPGDTVPSDMALPPGFSGGSAGAMRGDLQATLGAVHAGQPAAGAPGWAERSVSPVAVRTAGDFIGQLARASDTRQVVEIIMARGEEMQSTQMLPSPVIQVIQQIQGAAQAGGGEGAGASRRGSGRAPSTSTIRGGRVRGVRSSARVLSGWTGLPPGASASRTDGVGADRITRLVRKLKGLIHLAEAQNRLSDAQRQVRLAAADSPSAHQDGGGAMGSAEDADKQDVDIEALGREVLEIVNRELELRQERRQEDSDGSTWW
ncbi:MAG: hypothetical protein H6739_29825 [Alphaproteobacteria bacterium]|nr:hypothetical protein [Alphaproteobacteria bacterium]